MASLVLIKRNGVLVGCDDADRQLIARMKEGEPFRIETKAKRHVKRHRLYWKLMQILHDNTDQWPSAESASDSIKIAVGHVDQIADALTGEIHLRPKSIAFEKMDEAEFIRFFDRVVWVITARMIPNMDAETLRREVYHAIDGPERSSLGERIERNVA